MEQKIQELTEKIYQEGVERGEQKASQIISEAEAKASGIISEAKAQAEKILADARSQAEELKRNTESELKLSGSQVLSAIKQQILDLVTPKVIEDGTTQVLADPSNVKDFISTVIQNWKVSSGEVPDSKSCFLLTNRKNCRSLLKRVLLICSRKASTWPFQSLSNPDFVSDRSAAVSESALQMKIFRNSSKNTCVQEPVNISLVSNHVRQLLFPRCGVARYITG